MVARIKNMRMLDVKTKEPGDVVDEDGFSVVLCVKNGINDINILKIGKSDTYDYDYTDDIELLKLTCGMD